MTAAKRVSRRKRALRIAARVVFAVCVLLLVAAGLAPFVSADWLGEPVGAAISEALQRRVDMRGPVRWKLFGGPGITFADVVIHDDRSMGLEPLAYVDSLEVGFGLSSLWRGRLTFSHLRLVEPSVNLVQNAEGRWNYPELLGRAFSSSQRGAARLPRIEVRSGRLNFKYGDTKSVFCFTGADVDVWPDETDPDAVVVQFVGKPARTDRPAQSFGDVSGGGWLTLPDEGESSVRWNLRIERSSISELLSLMTGQHLNIEGFVASSARLEGPLSNIGITGELRLAEFNQRFLLPAAPDPVMRYDGELDLPGEQLRLSTVAADDSVLPLALEVRASDYMVQPDWQVAFLTDSMPIESLPPVIEEMGITLPSLDRWRGLLNGAIEWSRSGGLRGRLSVEDAETEAAGRTLRVDSADVLVDGQRIEVPETVVDFGPEGRIRVGAVYDRASERVQVSLVLNELSMEGEPELWKAFTGSEPPKMLSRFEGGTLSGRLVADLEGDAEARWSGEIEVKGTDVAVAGLAEDFAVESATVLPTDDGFTLTGMKGTLGGIPVEGRYEWSETADRPHHLDIEIDEAGAIELGELLGPLSARSRRGLIARTLRLGPAPPPDWLNSRRASGSVQIRKLSAGLLEFTDLGFDYYWDGTRIELVNFRTGIDRATLSGSASIDLSESSPEYLVRAAVDGLRWQGGEVTAEGRLRTSGTGLDVVANVSAEGAFAAHNVRTDSGEVLAEVSGCYELDASGIAPQLRLPCVRLRGFRVTYDGWGEGALLGDIDLDLFSGGDRIRAIARLAPFEFAVEPRQATATLK